MKRLLKLKCPTDFRQHTMSRLRSFRKTIFSYTSNYELTHNEPMRCKSTNNYPTDFTHESGVCSSNSEVECSTGEVRCSYATRTSAALAPPTPSTWGKAGIHAPRGAIMEPLQNHHQVKGILRRPTKLMHSKKEALCSISTTAGFCSKR